MIKYTLKELFSKRHFIIESLVDVDCSRIFKTYALPLPAFCICLLFFCSCGIREDKYNSLLLEKDSISKRYQTLLIEKEEKVKELRDSIFILSYPSEQRLKHIKQLVEEKEYTKAKSEIMDLQRIFPNSVEASSSEKLYEEINIELEKIEKEKLRVEALGFKGLKASSRVKIDYNTITISNLSVSNTFSFDSYGSHYRYRQADKGNKYVVASMVVNSTDKDPKLPQLAVYRIEGKDMFLVDRFDTEFARWDSYGTYLGNDADFNNDFSKVNSVRFKIGVQVEEDIIRNPYAVVVKKENALNRIYERFENPPVSYTGYVNYKSNLTMEDFEDDYILIQLFNLK